MLSVDAARRRLAAGAAVCPCTIGERGSVAGAEKREGDRRTPLGRWPLRAALFRPDRAAPPPRFALPWRWIRPDDGWCDDPGDPAYNRPVRLPYPASAERLWRDDHAYDIVIILGHNDAPAVPGNGSAIFFHLTNDRPFTEGCVAIARGDMDALLPSLHPGAAMTIVEAA